MGTLIAIVVGTVVFVGIFIAILASEQRDKEYRRANNLPPKKYHDITDYDVTTVFTIKDK